jgi:hypothetical protein
MVGEVQKLIGTNEVVEVEITQGSGGFPWKTSDLMNTGGMDCVKIGTNSILFLASTRDFTEESYSVVLTVPEDIELSAQNTEANEITGANFLITGHNRSGSLIFKISCKREE